MKVIALPVIVLWAGLFCVGLSENQLPINLNDRRYDMIYVNDNPSDVQTTACILRMHDLGIVNLLGIALDESRDSRQQVYDWTVEWVDAARKDWGIGQIPVWEGVPKTEARDKIVDYAKQASPGDELFIVVGGGTFVVADALPLLSDAQERNCIVYYSNGGYNDLLDPGGLDALMNSQMKLVLAGLLSKSYDRPKGRGCKDGNTCDFSLHDEGVPITPFTCDGSSYSGWWTSYAHGNAIRDLMIHAIEMGGSCVECQDADGVQMPALCPTFATEVSYDAGRTLWEITDYDNQALWRGKNIEDNWKDILNGTYPPPDGTTGRSGKQSRARAFAPTDSPSLAARLYRPDGRCVRVFSLGDYAAVVRSVSPGAYVMQVPDAGVSQNALKPAF